MGCVSGVAPLCVRLLCDSLVTVRAGKVIVMNFVVPTRSSNRAHFTTAQKLAILDEYDKCLEFGAKADLARVIGVKASTIHEWVLHRESGSLSSGSDTLEGKAVDQRLNVGNKKQLKHLQEENEVLKAKLAKSEAAVEILGKASALLEAMAKGAASTEPELPKMEPGRPEWLNPPPSKKSRSDSSEH